MPRITWLFLAASIAFATLLSPTPVQAQTYTWNNTTGNLNVGSNWTGGVAPTGAGAGSDFLTFGGASAYTATNTATSNELPLYYARNITFSNSSGGVTLTATGSPFTQMGFQLGGVSQGGTITQSGAAAATITAPIYSRYDNGSGSQTLTVRANSGSGQLTLGVASNTQSVFRGSQGVAFINNSTNAILIGNLSRLGGGINVSSGSVQQLAGVGGGVGRNEFGYSPLLVNNGASITLNDYGSDTNPNGGFGGLFVDSTGSVTGNVQVSGGGGGSFTNQFNGSLNGSLRINRTFGYVFNGTQVAAGKRLDLHNGSSMTLNGTFSATAGVQIDHGSTLNLFGNERLSGSTGVLQLAGGTIGLTGAASSNVSQTFATNGALTLTSSLGYSGASFINSTAGSGGTAVMSFGTAGGNSAFAAGARTGPGTLSISTGTGGTVKFFNTPLTNGLIGGGITFGSTALEWATLSGDNVVALSTYQTGTIPNNWLATENVKVSVAPTANLTVSRTINSLNMASENTLTLNAGTTLTVGTGGVIGFTSGSGSSVYRYQYINGSGTLTADTATSGGWLRFILGQGANTLETRLTVNSVIANQGVNTVGLVKSGNGTLYLGGANTFSGDVHIHRGTVSIAASNNLGNSPLVHLTGGELETTANMSLTQRLNVGASNGTLRMQFNTVTLSAANPIQGTNRGTLTIIGNGTIILSNADGGIADLSVLGIGPSNTLRLGTRLSGASLLGASTYVNMSGTLDGSWGNTTAVGAVNGGGTFRIRGGNTLTIGATDYPALAAYSGAFTQELNGVATATASNLVKVGTGTQWLTGASTYTGTTSVHGGTLLIAANVANATNGPVGNATSAVLLGNSTGTEDATLQLNAGLTFDRPVTVQSGSTGLVVLSGDNNASGLGTFSGAIALNRSVEVATPRSNVLLSGVVSGSGGIVKSGSNILTLTNANTYAGPTFVSEGALMVNSSSGSGTGTGSVTVLANATLGGSGRLAPTGANTVTVRGGSITAGTGAGSSTLTIASNGLTMEGGGYFVSLFGTGYTNSANAEISKLAVTGPVQISSTSVLRLNLSAISAAQVAAMRTEVGAGNSRVFNIIEGTGGVGNFTVANFAVSSLGQFAAGEWTLVSAPETDKVQLRFTPVPEPVSVFGVASVGLSVMSFVRRRRRAD